MPKILSRKLCTLLFLTACVLFNGCAHVKLQRRTNKQVGTLSSIYEKQVLDNIAMFCVNPDATPFFSTVSSGTIGVGDSVGTSGSSVWNATTFTSATLGPSTSRAFTNNWSVNAINDPTRLELMRCAYQKAIGRSTYANCDCPNCCDLARGWHSPGDLDHQAVTDCEPDNPNDVCGQKCNVTCAPGCGWYCAGGKHDAPKDNCSVVGEF